VRKRASEFVVVTFPEATASSTSSSVPPPSANTRSRAKLRATIVPPPLYGAERMYVLPASDVDQFAGSVLHSFLEQSRRAHASQSAAASAAAATPSASASSSSASASAASAFTSGSEAAAFGTGSGANKRRREPEPAPVASAAPSATGTTASAATADTDTDRKAKRIALTPRPIGCGAISVDHALSAAALPSDRFYSFELRDCTYEQFDVLYRIYTRQYVSDAQVKQCAALIQRMGVAHNFILLDAAPPSQNPPASASASASGGRNEARAAASTSTASTASTARPSAVVTHSDHRYDLIVCATEAHCRALSERAKVLGSPYIPFR
jgi:hypothetical protein